MSEDRPPVQAPWGPPTTAPPPIPPGAAGADSSRGRRRWLPFAIVGLAAVVAAAGAIALVASDDGSGAGSGSGEFGLLYQVAYGRTTFVVAGPDGEERERLTVPIEEVEEGVRIVPAGTGRAIVTSDASTVLVPLDGSEPTEIDSRRLTVASPSLVSSRSDLEGILLGEDFDAQVVVDFTTGRTRSLEDLIDADGPYIVSGYSADGQQASVLAGDELWLVPLSGSGPAQSLGQGRGGYSPDGRLAFLREQGNDRAELVVVDDDGNEEVVWSGEREVVPASTGERIALVGLDRATLVDPSDGTSTDTVRGVDLDPVSAAQTGGTLVSSDDDDRRWYRLDTGEEVGELRGLDVQPGATGDWIRFAGDGDDPALAAWHAGEGRVSELDGTATERRLLASGPETGVMQSPDGRFVVTGFARGDDEPLVLGDFETGEVVALAGDVAGLFSPDGRQLLVRRPGSDRGPGRLTIIDPAAPEETGIDLGSQVGAAAWVYV